MATRVETQARKRGGETRERQGRQRYGSIGSARKKHAVKRQPGGYAEADRAS